MGYFYSYESGLYFRGSTIANDFPKPSLNAFRFPFTAYRINHPSFSDADVMLRVKAGDQSAFEYLLQKYRRPIVRGGPRWPPKGCR